MYLLRLMYFYSIITWNRLTSIVAFLSYKGAPILSIKKKKRNNVHKVFIYTISILAPLLSWRRNILYGLSLTALWRLFREGGGEGRHFGAALWWRQEQLSHYPRNTFFFFCFFLTFPQLPHIIFLFFSILSLLLFPPVSLVSSKSSSKRAGGKEKGCFAHWFHLLTMEETALKCDEIYATTLYRLQTDNFSFMWDNYEHTDSSTTHPHNIWHSCISSWPLSGEQEGGQRVFNQHT